MLYTGLLSSKDASDAPFISYSYGIIILYTIYSHFTRGPLGYWSRLICLAPRWLVVRSLDLLLEHWRPISQAHLRAQVFPGWLTTAAATKFHSHSTDPSHSIFIHIHTRHNGEVTPQLLLLLLLLIKCLSSVLCCRLEWERPRLRHLQWRLE